MGTSIPKNTPKKVEFFSLLHIVETSIIRDETYVKKRNP